MITHTYSHTYVQFRVDSTLLEGQRMWKNLVQDQKGHSGGFISAESIFLPSYNTEFCELSRIIRKRQDAG